MTPGLKVWVESGAARRGAALYDTAIEPTKVGNGPLLQVELRDVVVSH